LVTNMSFPIQHPYLKTIQSLAAKKKVAVYLVGGFVRDCLLNRPCMDFDFAVERDAIKLARQFSKAIKGAFVLLDEEHGCARVVKKHGETIQTFDFADFRAKTLKGDLAHRDFTANALAVDLKMLSAGSEMERALIAAPAARRDLWSKTIRMTSAKAFKEDPLRLLRAFSVRAQLDFKIEPQTLARIKKDKNLLRHVSAERIREELFKILATEQAGQILSEMDKIKLLEEVIPQVTVMYNVTQGGYHHLNVWKHSLEAVTQLDGVFKEFQNDAPVQAYLDEEFGGHKRYAIIKLAMLLHDIGKPQTRKKEKDRFSFHGHEHVGRDISRNVAKLLKLSTSERYMVEDMVRWHLRPGYLGDFKVPSERAVFRYFRDAKDEAASILLLSIADQRATRGPLSTTEDLHHHVKTCKMLIEKFFEKKSEKPVVRLITGHDLIKKLKLKPSPLFAQILREVEEKQALGKVTNRAEALALAKKIAKV